MAREKRRDVLKKHLSIGGVVGAVAAIIIILIAIPGCSATPVIALESEEGNPITASQVILDGKDMGSVSGKVEVEALEGGDHTIIIIWNGAKYEKDFYYGGKEKVIVIQLPNPVSTLVSVWEKNLNKPIPNVIIYVDGEKKGTTNVDGACTFMLAPGDHTFKLTGDGVSLTKVRAVGPTSGTIEFEVEKVETIVVEVTDTLTGQAVENAEIYLDGVYKGETSVNGNLEISNVKDGSHQIEVTCKGVSESKSVTVSSANTLFSFSIPIPRTVTLIVHDTETGLSVREIDVYVDGELRGTTTRDGKFIIENILPGHHTVGVDVPGYTGMVNKYIEVGTQEIISLDVDVPNPVFVVGVDANSYWDFGEYGNVFVTLSNVGEVNSEGTQVLVLVYRDDNLTMPIASKVLSFPSLVPTQHGGQPVEKDWSGIDAFVWGPGEIVVVVIFDGCRYTPQNEQPVNSAAVSSSMVAELAYSVNEYLKAHPEEVTRTIAKIVIGWWTG